MAGPAGNLMGLMGMGSKLPREWGRHCEHEK